jgi:hypothetical protein
VNSHGAWSDETNYLSYDLVMDGLETIIADLEKQREAIDKALAALREVNAAPVASEGNARSIAQRARWAKTAKAGPHRKRVLTAAGRKALAESMKRRWAAKRTAAQAKKRKKAA